MLKIYFSGDGVESDRAVCFLCTSGAV
jgi:hypothetical protein